MTPRRGGEKGVGGVGGTACKHNRISLYPRNYGNWAARGERTGQKKRTNHKTQISPLVQKIPVHIDAVRLTQVLGYQSPDRRQVLLLELVRVLDIA